MIPCSPPIGEVLSVGSCPVGSAVLTGPRAEAVNRRRKHARVVSSEHEWFKSRLSALGFGHCSQPTATVFPRCTISPTLVGWGRLSRYLSDFFTFCSGVNGGSRQVASNQVCGKVYCLLSKRQSACVRSRGSHSELSWIHLLDHTLRMRTRRRPK